MLCCAAPGQGLKILDMVASVESSSDSFMIKLMLLTGTGSTWTERDPVDRRARQYVSRTEKGWSPITPEGPNRRDETTAHLWCDYELGMSSKQLLHPWPWPVRVRYTVPAPSHAHFGSLSSGRHQQQWTPRAPRSQFRDLIRGSLVPKQPPRTTPQSHCVLRDSRCSCLS